MNILPWQAGQWQLLADSVARDRFPHALLLLGPAGTGVREFAEALIARLLCDQPDLAGYACGTCRGCDLYRAGNHPDLFRVEREGAGKQIQVGTVREMIDFIHLSTHRGRYKIALIDPAEAMNRRAANGLLKTLEEPPGQSLLILVSHRPGALPATIRSRCQRVVFHPVFGDDAVTWLAAQMDGSRDDAMRQLALSGGAPLAALESLDAGLLEQHEAMLGDLVGLRARQSDPVATAQRWAGIGAELVLQWLLALLAAMTRRQLPDAGTDLNSTLYGRHLQQLANGLDLPQLVDCYDLVQNKLHAMTGPFNLNRQSILEEIAAHWQSLNGSRGGRQA